jgi:Na+/H+ antiporter NhaA
VFYTAQVSLAYLLSALAVFGVLIVLNRVLHLSRHSRNQTR